jgi:PadR family transcriptional regulator, regulatory protein PadR
MPEAEKSERWEAQFRKGCLELAILATLLQGRLYGLEILRRLESNPKMAIGEGTVYPILGRLKSEGLVDSEWVEADAGHPRKYYRLTRAGRARIREMAAFWNEFSGSLDSLLAALE